MYRIFIKSRSSNSCGTWKKKIRTQILTLGLKLKFCIQKVPKYSYSMIAGLYAMIASIAGGDF